MVDHYVREISQATLAQATAHALFAFRIYYILSINGPNSIVGKIFEGKKTTKLRFAYSSKHVD